MEETIRNASKCIKPTAKQRWTIKLLLQLSVNVNWQKQIRPALIRTTDYRWMWACFRDKNQSSWTTAAVYKKLFLLPRCWRRSHQRNLWKTDLRLNWTLWNTETGWEENSVCDREDNSVVALTHAHEWCCCLRTASCQARLWVQLMKELRQGVKLKKVQEQPFNPLPTEFSLTPFEMLMQDIRARKFQLRKVMVRVQTWKIWSDFLTVSWIMLKVVEVLLEEHKLKSVELFLQSKHLKLWNVFTGNVTGVISGQTGIRLETFFRHLTCMDCKLALLQEENIVGRHTCGRESSWGLLHRQMHNSALQCKY